MVDDIEQIVSGLWCPLKLLLEKSRTHFESHDDLEPCLTYLCVIFGHGIADDGHLYVDSSMSQRVDLPVRL